MVEPASASPPASAAANRYLIPACLLVAIGAYVIVDATITTLWIHASQDWPTVPGTVVSSSVVNHGGNHPWYQLQVDYRYQVDGADCVGSRLSWVEPLFSDLAVAENLRSSSFAVGETVIVHVEPGNANVSVIAPMMDGTALKIDMPWMIGFGAVGLGVGLLVQRWRLLRRRTVPPNGGAAR